MVDYKDFQHLEKVSFKINWMTTLNVKKDSVEKFSYLINYDIGIFFDLYRIFVNDNLPNIVEYYSNKETVVDQYSFNYLSKLINQSIIIDNLIKTNLSIMDNMYAWEILDFFEDVKIKLATFDNLSKWTRSSKTKASWGQSSVQIDYTVGEYETLEEVSGKFFDSTLQQNNWQDIALQNNLTELEYTTKGGTILKINKDINISENLYLNSVVDNLVGKKMYGLDFNKKITFIVDSDGSLDLDILSYEKTVVQSFEILLRLNKGDIPELPNLGKNNVIGNNVMTFYYVSLTKQLTATFATDDSLQDFSVLNIFYKNGDIYLKCSVNTFYNLTLNKETKI